MYYRKEQNMRIYLLIYSIIILIISLYVVTTPIATGNVINSVEEVWYIKDLYIYSAFPGVSGIFICTCVLLASLILIFLTLVSVIYNRQIPANIEGNAVIINKNKTSYIKLGFVFSIFLYFYSTFLLILLITELKLYDIEIIRFKFSLYLLFSIFILNIVHFLIYNKSASKNNKHLLEFSITNFDK